MAEEEEMVVVGLPSDPCPTLFDFYFGKNTKLSKIQKILEDMETKNKTTLINSALQNLFVSI